MKNLILPLLLASSLFGQSATVWKPKLNTSWQWQLSGAIDLTVDAEMYDLDMFETSAADVAKLRAAGRKTVCYVSVGTYEPYRPDSAQFPASVKGKALEGFADENWLDIRRWDILGPIMEKRFDLCKSKGFDAVEPDNVDGYTNDNGFGLTYTDQLQFNRRIADIAHARGLSVGLKNDLDQIKDLLPHFDWALNEQCFQFRECALLSPFVDAGKAVFNVEYQRQPEQFCSQANALNFNSLAKKVELDAYRVPCRTGAAAGVTAPAITGVVNSASYRGGSVAPGEIVAVFGTDLGPTAALGLRLEAGLVATQLADVKLLFDGIAAPLLYAGSGQLLAVVPYAIAGKARTSIEVDRGGVRSTPFTMNVAASWPGIFTANATGSGQAAMFNQDGTLNGPTRRARPGSVVTLFATGEGAVQPAGRDGAISAAPLPAPLLPVTVTIANKPAEVLYAGAAPSLVAGVLQINVRVPAGIASTEAALIELKVGERVSQLEVVMAVDGGGN
ncbi:MAG: endo alpha-1,4 polygalactosaminidase [Bryobacterales bacterium]|nr:endo alpha-1,4 polygalactosaminidase [Bryobacterales bacterium]